MRQSGGQPRRKRRFALDAGDQKEPQAAIARHPCAPRSARKRAVRAERGGDLPAALAGDFRPARSRLVIQRRQRKHRQCGRHCRRLVLFPVSVLLRLLRLPVPGTGGLRRLAGVSWPQPRRHRSEAGTGGHRRLRADGRRGLRPGQSAFRAWHCPSRGQRRRARRCHRCSAGRFLQSGRRHAVPPGTLPDRCLAVPGCHGCC